MCDLRLCGNTFLIEIQKLQYDRILVIVLDGRIPVADDPNVRILCQHSLCGYQSLTQLA